MVLVSMDVIVDIKELIANKVESILNISKKKLRKFVLQIIHIKIHITMKRIIILFNGTCQHYK